MSTRFDDAWTKKGALVAAKPDTNEAKVAKAVITVVGVDIAFTAGWLDRLDEPGAVAPVAMSSDSPPFMPQ